MENTPQTDNKGGFYDDFGDLKYYEEKLKRRKKRTKIILVSIALFLVFSIVFTLFFFSYHTLSYDEMYGGVQAVERDGFIYFDFYATDSGYMAWSAHGPAVLYDYENGVRYTYLLLQIQVQRWHLWFSKGVHRWEDKFYSDGKDSGRIEKWKYDPDFDYKSNPIQMDDRYIRAYYENPDGTYVLIWELPEAQEIAERVGAELPEPDESFQLKIGNRR